MRRAAAQLLTTLLAHNPFAGELRGGAIRVTLAEFKGRLRAKERECGGIRGSGRGRGRGPRGEDSGEEGEGGADAEEEQDGPAWEKGELDPEADAAAAAAVKQEQGAGNGGDVDMAGGGDAEMGDGVEEEEDGAEGGRRQPTAADDAALAVLRTQVRLGFSKESTGWGERGRIPIFTQVSTRRAR